MFSTVDGETIEPIILDHGDAAESEAYGIVAAGGFTAATGITVDAAGRPRAVVWRSDDGGASFGPPEQVIERPGYGSTIDVADGRLVVIAARRSDDGNDLVAVVAGHGGWTRMALPEDGMYPFASGMAVSGSTVVVTGGYDAGERQVAAAWVSTDSGTTFTRSADPAIAQNLRLGTPALGGDGFVATAAAPGNGATTLVTTADGQSWRSIALRVTGPDDAPSSLNNGGSGGVIAFGDGFTLGTVDVVAAMARVGANGAGRFSAARAVGPGISVSPPNPFTLGGALHAWRVGARSFDIVRFDAATSTWAIVGELASSNEPIPLETRIDVSTTGPFAAAATSPHVDLFPNGGYGYGPETMWNSNTDGDWPEPTHGTCRRRSTSSSPTAMSMSPSSAVPRIPPTMNCPDRAAAAASTTAPPEATGPDASKW